jgi:glycosyltransferase involved in cell wall biosynthesis/2-polyprenyl-3-methyl-5-hydroxy-6-metoxy-1,4-benzoquinol methylase
MRIGFVVTHFSPLSESFVRREVLALCALGHRVFVYADCLYYEPQAEVPSHPNLTIRNVPFLRNHDALSRAVFDDGIDHLHGSLMAAAHRATLITARELQTLFTLRVYSGVDVFTRRDPDIYRDAATNQLCVGIIVEDEFMFDWMEAQYGVPRANLTIIPNSFDLDTYRLAEPRPPKDDLIILSIARFVPKKGLRFLVEAFHDIAARHKNAQLWLAGFGPQDAELRALAAGSKRISFLGAVSEQETRRLYEAADIFCLPCITADSGDADGIPTTILEAMAFELPVVGTEILSAPQYVTNGRDGLLVPPKDAGALATALDQLAGDPDLRLRLGRGARTRVTALCDIRLNAKRLEEVFAGGRWKSWKAKLAELETQRSSYTTERLTYYRECRLRALDFFKPQAGRLLDIGCWLGELKDYLPATVEYYGCDPAARQELSRDFPFITAGAESLPFPDNFFDSAVFYAVLIHVFDADRALAEATRVLKPGGRLYLQECYDDPNPIHMNHFSAESLRARVAEHLNVVRAAPANEYLMMMVAEKPVTASIDTALKESAVTEPACHFQTVDSDLPLVSICITTFNRAGLVRQSIDSVLRQTFPRVEVVVVDDGSNDDTRRVLENYGTSIQVAFNEHNRGMAYSKNRALRLTSASAKYVGILDSDDYFDPRFVAACVETLEQNPAAGLVYTDDIMVDESGHELWRQPAVHPWSTDAWLRTCNLRGDTWLARRGFVMQTDLHDEDTEHDHDYDLFFQLLEITTFVHIPEYLVFIRQHTGRSSGVNRLEVARDHAANLVKYGFSPEYAYLRARRNPEWVPAIKEGIALGEKLRGRRKAAHQNASVVASRRDY